MIANEKTMQFLEEHIPDLAAAAFTQAYWQALASGSSVLKVEDGAIIEVFPDGSRKWVKQIPPLIPVPIGKKRMLKCVMFAGANSSVSKTHCLAP